MTRADGRLRAQSVNLGSLGVVRGYLGDLRQRRRLHNAGLRIAEAIGGAGLQAAHLRNLAKVSMDLGLLDLAQEYLDRAMRLEPDKEETGRVLRVAAHLYAARGEHDTALRYAESALSQADEYGYQLERIWMLTAVAMVLNRLGRHEEAVAAAGRALHETAADVKEGRIEALVERAVGRIELGEIEAAKADAATMLALAREGGFRIGEGLALNVAAEAAIRSGEPSRAHVSVGQALEIFRRCGHRAGESWSLWILGAAAQAEGDRAAREVHWSRVEQIHWEIGAPLPARFKMERD
jgi:tetratricopeptide (TPR) repeat protein